MSLLAGGNLSGNRPGCWGKTDVYDNQSRDCRGCGFQSSCRDQIIKQTMANQPAVPNMSVPSYSTQFLTPTPFAVPQPQQVAPPPMFHPAAYAPQVPQPPQPPQPQQVPVQVMKFNPPTFPAPAAPPQMFQQPRPPQPQPVQQQMGMGMQDFYGRVQDPLFFALMQPPPFRPQMEGETFMERFGKNLMLDLGAMACFHFGLALRQMFLPPQPPSLPPEKVINGP